MKKVPFIITLILLLGLAITFALTIKSMKKELVMLKLDSEKSSTDIQDLSRQIRRLKGDISDLEDKIDDLESQVEDLENRRISITYE